MRAFEKLPEEYHEIYSVDLQKNKKIALLVNALAIVIAAAMAVPAALTSRCCSIESAPPVSPATS